MASATLLNWKYNADGRLALLDRLSRRGRLASDIEAVCERDFASTNDLENVFSGIVQRLGYKAPIYKQMAAGRLMDRLAYLRTHSGDYGIVARLAKQAKYEQKQMAAIRGKWWNSAAALRSELATSARNTKMARIQAGATKACTITARLFNKLKKGSRSAAS